jgi:sporulation protein YlmC with PRC-barrel domain
VRGKPQKEGVMAPHETKATLVRLSDTELTMADGADDIRGRDVVDISGEELGEVDDLLIDDGERKVRFLEVASGGFPGWVLRSS